MSDYNFDLIGMKIVLQRVSQAAVEVDRATIASIDAGILVLAGFGKEDSISCLAPMIEKIITLRIFPNLQGRFDRSLLDTGGALLLVPQFTLFADTSKGRRPEFFGALAPVQAELLFEHFVELSRNRLGSKVACGRFGADMKVSLVNDGPVTITLES